MTIHSSPSMSIRTHPAVRGSEGRPGWIAVVDPTPTIDVTRRFLALHTLAGRGGDVLPPDAGAHRYLTIGGLFGEHVNGYMDANVEALSKAGLEVHRVPVDPGGSVKGNAEVVRHAVQEATADGRQAVLVGHSKGGVDAAAALSIYPELKARVRALVAIQSPFGGSPIAQDMDATPSIRPLIDGVVSRLFRGDPPSVRDLTYDAREEFLAQHPLPTDVPCLCVASSRLSPASVLARSEAYLEARYGFRSDGLVAPEDAVIPGAHVVRLADMDHAESALRGLPGFSHYFPGEVTLASVALALDAARRHGSDCPQ